MIMEQEKKSEIHKMKIFQNFKKKVINSKYKLLNLLIDLRKKKKKLYLQ